MPENKKPKAILGQLGSLKTRLAHSEDEILSAQKVRHHVFYKSRNQTFPYASIKDGIESDYHDKYCDHLIVYEEDAECQGTISKIAGTQRFFTRHGADRLPAFRSQPEFDVEGLVSRHQDRIFMELGRSCILPEYRNKRTLELMWQGTWAYSLQNRVDVMIGCASFDTCSENSIREELEFLVHTSPTSDVWQIQPNAPTSIKIRPTKIPKADARKIIRKLPPLIKGYLYLGAMFSDHAVFDPELLTIDIFIILPVDRINRRYIQYYGEDVFRHNKNST